MAMAADWKPAAQVEIVVPNSPGGGNDAVARLMQKIVQDRRLVPTPVVVVNKPAGGGSATLSYLGQKLNDPHTLAVVSITQQLTYIGGTTAQGYRDFTPLATMIGDFIGFAVRADSPITSGKDLIERLKKDPSNNAILRTNCVATQLAGGHAPNALPQRATANVNCRMFPGRSAEEVRQELIAAIADPGVTVEFQSPPEKPGVQPPLSREVMAPIEALSRDMYPGIAVIPTINSGATDGRFLTPVGIPTYGVSGMLSDGATSNAHGLNERIRVQTLIEGREFLYRLTKAYAGGK